MFLIEYDLQSSVTVYPLSLELNDLTILFDSWNCWFTSPPVFSQFPMSLKHGIFFWWILSSDSQYVSSLPPYFHSKLCSICRTLRNNEPWQGFDMGFRWALWQQEDYTTQPATVERIGCLRWIVGHSENKVIVFIQETPSLSVLWLEPYVSTKIKLMVYHGKALFPFVVALDTL